MIRAVVFDLDNTLMDFMAMKESAIRAAVNAMIDAGLTMEPEEAKRVSRDISHLEDELARFSRLENEHRTISEMFDLVVQEGLDEGDKDYDDAVEMLEALAIEQADRVLEVGAGSGWNAALMAELVGAQGRVVTVEVSEELARAAQERLLPWKQVSVLCADGRLGAPAEAPYDRIIVTAGTRKIYDAWMNQLEIGGILVTPIDAGMDFSPMLRIVKRDDRLEVKELSYARFVPLRSVHARQPDPPGTPVEKLLHRI